MPATQHDAVLWLSGSAYDVLFDTARGAIAAMEAVAAVAEESSSWPYQHDRDLTGFIDGSENPSLIDAPEFAVIPDGDPGAQPLTGAYYFVPSTEALRRFSAD